MKPIFYSFIGFVCLVVFIFSVFSFASVSVFTLNFDPDDLIFEKVQGYDKVKILDGRFSAEPGSPLLPARFVQIAIPADLEVERVNVISSDFKELPGTYLIYPAQPLYPLFAFPTKIEFVGPDPLIYQSASEYPGKLAQLTNNGFLGGQHVAGVVLYPLQYIPSEGKLILSTRIEFELVFKPSSHFPAPINKRSERGVKFYSDLAKSLVVNPEAVQMESRGFLSLEEEVDYLIITDDSLVSVFQDLALWKTLKGIPAEIEEVSWVLSTYAGYDDQEKIRNCIRDYYSNHGTKWVLLGGDTPILPHRVVQVMGENIPCDLYFSDLDSNWDANGNHIYGEYGDSVDIYPDVFVGRAPCTNISQAQTFVNKCLTYETNSRLDHQTRILFAAEEVWPGTDAAELKEYIDSSFVPDHFETVKLYQTWGNLNRETFRDSLNFGHNIINHSGHGNYDRLGIGSDTWFSWDMDRLVNSPRHSLLYSYGCITAAIDMDCIAEHFINNPDGGGFAYCGNTREGWGQPGAPLEGPGAEFDIEFFRALFDSSTYQVGKTLGNSKIPFIPISQQTSVNEPYYRWTMFSLLLLGDPTLELWTDIPADLSVSHEPIFFAGSNYFQVNVAQDSSLVCCVKEGEILGTAYSSEGFATVYFDSALISLGTLHLTITKHNYLPYHDTVLVIPPEGPFIIYNSHQTDDSWGNNNGVVNPDETINMSITVENIGIENASGVSGTLREEDDYIVVSDSVKSFGNIDSGMTAVSIGDYMFEVDPFCTDSHVVKFTLEATDGESLWITEFFQLVGEPDIMISAVPDTALVQKGDSAEIKLIFESVGGFNWQVDLTHKPLPPEVAGFLNPEQLSPTDSSIFTICTTQEAYPGIYPITITATGGGITREKEVVLGIVSPPYYGPIWHVSISGHDLVGNGSEEFPFGTIQKGIESATDEDTVLVAAGTYYEHIDFMGKSILVKSESGPESTMIAKSQDRMSIVSFASGEDTTSILDGFTIIGAYLAENGGGIYAESSSPRIISNIIKDNSAREKGPGVFCRTGHPILEANTIMNNSGGGGGGVFMSYCNASIRNNLIKQNGSLDGGGIFLLHCSGTTIEENLIYSCSTEARGGGVVISSSSNILVANNTIVDNTALQGGGGVCIWYSDSTALINNIIAGSTIGSGVYSYESSNSVIEYNDVWNNTPIDYDGISPGAGCISADPWFCEPENHNYYLHSTSPCQGAGQGGTDIGAYGVGCGSGDANGDGAIDISDVVYLINYLFKQGPAPDPIEKGDVNCDEEVTIADVIYLTNYLFKDGPRPC